MKRKFKILILVFNLLLTSQLFASSNIVNASYQAENDEVFFYAKYMDGSQKAVYSIPISQFFGGFKYLGNGLIEYTDNPNINTGANPQAESGFFDINTSQSAKGFSPVLTVDITRRLVALGTPPLKRDRHYYNVL